MKVLHVIPSVGPLRGGPSFVLRGIASGLAAEGVEVHVATTDDNGAERLPVAFNTPVDEDGAVYRYFPRQGRFYIVSVPIANWLWANIAAYDIVHIHAVFSWASNIAAGIARLKGVPYIIRPLGILNRYGMEQRRPALKRLSFALCEKRLLEGAAAIQYTSALERQEAEELGFRGRPVIIGNPVVFPRREDIDMGAFRRRYPSLRDKTVYLFFSRVVRKKGLDLLIPALAGLRQTHSNAALAIAGDGPPDLLDTLRQSAQSAGLNDIVWTGFLSGKEKWEALAGSDVFVLPSYSENFGVAVVEAMGISRPVIVSSNVGIQADIAGAGAGLVVDCSVPSLTGAMASLYSNRTARESLGAHGLQLVQQRYSQPAVCAQMLELYRNIIRIRSN